MIESNELRIGNLVIFEGKIYQISSINGDNTIRLKCEDEMHENYYNGSIGCYDIQRIKPIILTKEILLKLGFKNVKNGIGIKIPEGIILASLFTGYPLTIEVYGNRSPLFHIKYVHQLQNLCFDLSAQELTF